VNEDAALWAAREILPLVRKRVPDSRLLLVGSRPSAAVRALASESVEVPGWVESIAPWYERAAVALVPIRAGSGIRGKILQALGVGRPVVATPIGAEGIEAREEDGLFVRDEPAELAAAVVALLEGAEHARWHDAGRRWFDAAYRWEQACAEWESMLVELACASR
jgi:glycosyltransferase involved in cell wall biosynthesis